LNVSPRLKAEYVSKTDIYAYRRCPYTFHLVESGQISRAEAFSPIEAALMDDGIAFEDGILAEMPTTMRRLDDPKLLEETGFIYGIDTIVDHERKLVGQPDGFELRGRTHRSRSSGASEAIRWTGWSSPSTRSWSSRCVRTATSRHTAISICWVRNTDHIDRHAFEKPDFSALKPPLIAI